MSVIYDVLLGAISGAAQGIFEWIPVSSKTILLMIFYWAGYPPSTAYLLGLFLNGSTALAAAIYLRKEVYDVLRGVRFGGMGRRTLLFLVSSTAVTGLVGAPLAWLVAESLEKLDRLSMLLVGVLYLATSILLWARKGIRPSTLGDLKPIRDGIVAGLAQGFSTLPGVSRSGTTILTLLLLGYHPTAALKLSFLMSIPATIGGSIYSYMLHGESVSALPQLAILASILTALLISITTISMIMRASEKLKPHLFTLILAALTIATALQAST